MSSAFQQPSPYVSQSLRLPHWPRPVSTLQTAPEQTTGQQTELQTEQQPERRASRNDRRNLERSGKYDRRRNRCGSCRFFEFAKPAKPIAKPAPQNEVVDPRGHCQQHHCLYLPNTFACPLFEERL